LGRFLYKQWFYVSGGSVSSKAHKKLRQQAAAAEMAKRYEETERQSPLSRSHLNSLLDFLAERIAEDGHDKSLKHTAEWLSQNGLPAEPALEFLKAHRMMDDWSVAIDGDPNKLFGPAQFQFARMPIPLDALEELIHYIDERVSQLGCDHTRRFCREWLVREGWPGPPTEFALIAQGGGCDCEIVMNVEPSNIYRRPAGVDGGAAGT
jgi:Protein of unknown function (DUF2695)